MTPDPSRKPRDAAPPATAEIAHRDGPRSRRPARPAAITDAGLLHEYEAFYRAYVATLVTYVLYLGATEEQAAEFAQQALVGALVRWRKIEHPRSWCRTVVRRAYYHWLFDAHRADDDVPPESPLLADPGPEPDRRAAERAELDDLVALVVTLPPKQREVMALSLLEMTPTEIARELGKPPDRICANLRRARTNLRSRRGQTDEPVEDGR